MQTLTINSLKTFLHTAISLDEPVMVWGPPGCGKTETMAQLATSLSGYLASNYLSQYDSVDLRGFPHTVNGIYKHVQAMAWAPPITLPFEGNTCFPDDRPVILFLDEINSAAPSVAAVAYQLINDRRVGEHKLKPNVRIIAAGNREGDRGVTNKMPLPLANRMTHVEVVMDADSWVDYHLDQGGDPLFAAFFKFRPALICTFDPASNRKAFGTYRSWSKAAKYLASDAPDAIKRAMVSGAVGDGEASELFAFRDVVGKLPDIDKLLSNPEKADLFNDVALNYALAVALSTRLAGEDTDQLDRAATYLDRMSPEYSMLAWMLAFKKFGDGGAALIRSPNGAKYAKKIAELIGVRGS